MATNLEKEKKRLRQYLNQSIKGKNTDIILESLASASCHLIDNVEAVNDMLYITSAKERYLDSLLADRDLTRPDNVGLSDEDYRSVGIEVVNRKQVRDLVHKILEIMYGEEFVRGSFESSEIEPYLLKDGDTLEVQFDGSESVEVVFTNNQFENINTASAQEVSDAIIRSLRNSGKTGSAFARDDGAGSFVTIISGTNGPSSSVKILGGRAQNVLKFPEIRPTTATVFTEWTVEIQPSGSTRLIWTGGANPSVGKIYKNDYINIYGDAFDDNNKGTFTISEVKGGLIGDAYVEFNNIYGVDETVLQGDLEGVLFFNPKRALVSDQRMFAAAYQTETRLLEVFMPATTRVVRRDRKGAAHLHESGPSTIDDLGPYIFDSSKGYLVGDQDCSSTIVVDSSIVRVVDVDDSSEIPDEEGYLIFGFGTSKEEGPVPYTARPSNTTLLINPAYKFKNVHKIGTNISFVTQNSAYNVEKDASDYPFYITDVVSGRIYAEDLIKLIAATGIVLNLVILYPSDIGLGKWGDYKNSERYYIWGKDASDTLFDKEDINDRI